MCFSSVQKTRLARAARKSARRMRRHLRRRIWIAPNTRKQPQMKITKLQVYVLRAPDTARPHWVSHFIVPKANEILVRLQTDEGVEGIGLATSYTPVSYTHLTLPTIYS